MVKQLVSEVLEASSGYVEVLEASLEVSIVYLEVSEAVQEVLKANSWCLEVQEARSVYL